MKSQDSIQEKSQLAAQKLCAHHGNKECLFLCTDPARKDDVVFKCEFCVVEQTLQAKYLLPISQIAASNLKTVFWHWPFPDNPELLEKVRELSIREKPDTVYKKKIDQFFEEMKIEVMAKIDEVQASMNKQAETLWDFDHVILEQYSQLSAKEALKNAVIDNSADLEQLSIRIREIVAGIFSDTEVAQGSLSSNLNQLELQESAVDFSSPQRIKEEVLASISKISMFLVEDMQDLQMQPAGHFGEMEEEEEEHQGNLDAVLRLASCSFNGLSEGFRENLGIQLQKFRKIFDKIQLGDVEGEIRRVTEFESLEEGEVQEVKAFAERLVENKKRRERGENGNNLQVDDLMKLLSNKSNHASEELIVQAQAMLEGVSRYIGTFEVDSIYKDGYNKEQFEGMSDSEIRIAAYVIQEIKELFREGQKNQEILEEVINIAKQTIKSMNQPQQKNERSLNTMKIMELVKNQTNFCSEEYAQCLQSALKGVQHYLESFKLIEKENEELGIEQLNDLGQLINKIKELSVKFGKNYKERSRPNEEEQPKSVAVSRWLSKHIEETALKELDRLLCKIPLFELSLCDWKQPCISKWKWMKTNFSQSSSLQILNENNGVRIIQTTKCQSQAVTETTLDNSLVYSVKCSFNKPLNGVNHIMVGLIPEDQINGWYFINNRNHGFWSDPEYGPTQIIKGQLLNSAALNTTLTTILFRFCIQTQTFLLSDTTLQNISMLDKDKINPNTKYRFGICFFSNIGNDYSCLFSDVMTSIDQASVDEF